MKKLMGAPLSIAIAVALISGCSSTAKTDNLGSLRATIEEQKAALAAQKAENSSLKESLQTAQQELNSGAGTAAAPAGSNPLLPPNAKAGECYARVLLPPKYELKTKRLLKKAATSRVQTTPPRYELVDQKVLVKEASESSMVVPAKYDYVTEKVLVKEASEKLVVVPAKYETKSEKVLVKAAYKTWKKGTGPIQKIDNATGEIMCLVEVPAVYKTVSKRVEVEPPRTVKKVIPAQYKTVKRRVMVEPPKVVKKAIPAQYKVVKVQKLVQAAQEKRIEIPAEYQTVTERTLVKEAYLEWASILCETNTTPSVVRKLQLALKAKGFNPGPIDGVIGWETMRAVKGFQKSKNMASGQLTLETLRALNVQ